MSSLTRALLARGAAIPIDPADVLSWVESMIDGQYTNAVLATLLVYDSVCTMDSEVKYFWKLERPFSRPVMNIVYFTNRYTGILGAVSYFLINSFNATLLSCQYAQWVHNIVDSITIILIDYMLMRRVEALYSHTIWSRNLNMALRSLLVLETIAKFALMIYATIATEIVLATFTISSTSHASYVCGQNYNAAESVVVLDWLIPLVYGVILLVLVLWAAFLRWKETRGLGANFGFAMHMVRLMVNDQLKYFIVVVMVSFFNTLQIKLSSNLVWANVLNGVGSPTLLCVLGSRMMLSLKEAGDGARNSPEEVEGSWGPKFEFDGGEGNGSRGGMVFAKPGGGTATETNGSP